MTIGPEISNHEWRSAAKQSFLRWPARVALGGTVACLLNIGIGGNRELDIGSITLGLVDGLCLFSCALVATFPVAYYTTSRLVHRKPKVTATKQIFMCLGLLVFALLVAPRFKIEHRDYDPQSENNRRDVTTTLIKRSFLETLQLPQLALDELEWLQSNFSATYIPAQVFCPRRSTRLYPLFGFVRDDHLANALAPGIGEADSYRPPLAALKDGIARCNREGPAMLAAGHTKESALLQGDIDRFFGLNALEASPNQSIVLEDTQIPASILAKIESVLSKRTEDPLRYLEDTSFDIARGQVRRLTPLVLAVALGRSNDVARLRRSE